MQRDTRQKQFNQSNIVNKILNTRSKLNEWFQNIIKSTRENKPQYKNVLETNRWERWREIKTINEAKGNVRRNWKVWPLKNICKTRRTGR